MRPKIALCNAVAPSTNQTRPPHDAWASPQWRSAHGKSSSREKSSARVNWIGQSQRGAPGASREAALDLANFVRHQISAGGTLHLVGKHDFRRPGRVVGRSGPNLSRRLGLRERDLGLGLLGATGDEFLQPLGGLNAQLRGLGSRLGNDGGGVRFRFGGLFLEARQQLGSLLAELGGLSEFGCDRFAARVKRLEHNPRRAKINENADEHEEAEKDEELRIIVHHAAPLTDWTERTAAAIDDGSAGRPPRRSTIAPAASRATSATLAIASARVLAISRSASVSLAASSSPSACRLAWASAAAASRAAWARLCAFARASANVFSCAAAAASAFCCIAVASSRSPAIRALRPSITAPSCGKPRLDRYQ